MRLLRSQVRGLLQKIDMDGKMKKMAELQLTVVSNPKNRKAIENQVRAAGREEPRWRWRPSRFHAVTGQQRGGAERVDLPEYADASSGVASELFMLNYDPPLPPEDVSIPRDACRDHVTRPALGFWLRDRGDEHMLYFYLWVGGRVLNAPFPRRISRGPRDQLCVPASNGDSRCFLVMGSPCISLLPSTPRRIQSPQRCGDVHIQQSLPPHLHINSPS